MLPVKYSSCSVGMTFYIVVLVVVIIIVVVITIMLMKAEFRWVGIGEF